MSRSSSKVVTADQPQHPFDLISGLHSRFMNDVLQLIFQYLDREGLQNVEITSQAWKEAISDGNPKQLWGRLLKQKVANSSLWENLHFHIAPAFSESLDSNSWSLRKLFSKIEFTIKTLHQNWMECEYTREFGDCEVGFRSRVFQLNNKFIVLWESTSGVFKIWNRMSLKLEEIYHVFPIHDDLDYELFEDALIYSLGNSIMIRNLSTKKTSVYKPLGLDNNRIINYLRAEGGFLAAVTYVKGQTHIRQNAYIWKMNSPTNINWEDVTIIPISMSLANKCVIYMDSKFLIFVIETSSKRKFEVRKMSKPQQKGLNFSLPQTRQPMMYFEGNIMTINEKGKIVVVNMESGITRKNVIQPNANLSDPATWIRMSSSGLIFVCSNVGYTDFPAGIEIWDFKALKDPTTELPHKPLISFKTFIGPADLLYADEFGFVTAHQGYSSDCTIHEINFLPLCNFCKEIRKRLSRCGRCKLAKYCGSLCQKADWQHHRRMCTAEKDFPVLEKNVSVSELSSMTTSRCAVM